MLLRVNASAHSLSFIMVREASCVKFRTESYEI